MLRPLLTESSEGEAWDLARGVLRSGETAGWRPPTSRQIRLAILCTYEAAELVTFLSVACQALRIDATVYAAPFGQLEQEILDPESGLARFAPTHVVVAPTSADLDLPDLAARHRARCSTARWRRWTRLWTALADNLDARVVQHTFVVPDESPFGHLSTRLAASRVTLVRELNARLGAERGRP